MKDLKIIIIGNRLTEFANNRNILTYDQFNYLLQIESKSFDQNRYEIHLGQGLSDLQINIILKNLNKPNLHRFSLSGVLHQLERAGSALTHKRKIENNMISTPEKISEFIFKSYLMLDESCAEMLDHVTGQHIQGMVLVEAARQMVNSVSEKFLISKQIQGKKGFVLNALNATFLEYVFPLDVELIFNTEKLREGLYGNFKANADIHLFQNNRLVMSVEVDFSVMEKTALLGLESQRAESAINEVIQISKNAA